MSAQITIVRNAFNKIFNNLSKDLGEPISSIQLGIYYDSQGKQNYEVFKNFKKEKDIKIGDFIGRIIDFSGGTAIIDATIAQAGASYSKELGTPIQNIGIIMQHVPDKLPMAVLMVSGKKERNIDIQKDFLQ